MLFLAQDASPLGSLGGILPILLVGAVFWFLVIRPQRKRQAERDAMLQTVSVGDEVVTIGGIFGVVDALDDNWVDLEVAEDVLMRVSRGSIGRIATDEDLETIEEFATGPAPATAPDTGPETRPDAGTGTGPIVGGRDPLDDDADAHGTEA